MCDKEITDVFTTHAEYEPLSDPVEVDRGQQLFIFTNDDGESITYSEFDYDSFIATHTDREGEVRHYRVTPQRSIRVSTLVVNRYGYTLVEDATDIGFTQETTEA